jgi:hypothetical protein
MRFSISSFEGPSALVELDAAGDAAGEGDAFGVGIGDEEGVGNMDRGATALAIGDCANAATPNVADNATVKKSFCICIRLIKFPFGFDVRATKTNRIFDDTCRLVLFACV